MNVYIIIHSERPHEEEVESCMFCPSPFPPRIQFLPMVPIFFITLKAKMYPPPQVHHKEMESAREPTLWKNVQFSIWLAYWHILPCEFNYVILIFITIFGNKPFFFKFTGYYWWSKKCWQTFLPNNPVFI